MIIIQEQGSVQVHGQLNIKQEKRNSQVHSWKCLNIIYMWYLFQFPTASPPPSPSPSQTSFKNKKQSLCKVDLQITLYQIKSLIFVLKLGVLVLFVDIIHVTCLNIVISYIIYYHRLRLKLKFS